MAEEIKGAPPPADNPVFETLIPEEYRDKGYLADLKKLPVGPDGYKELFKKLDGAQTLIGRKIGIPGADAAPEEVDKFYTSLRPAKAEEYEFEKKEGQTIDEDFLKSARSMFHDAGLSKTQAQKLVAKFDAFIAEKSAPQIEAAKKLDAEFDEMSKKAFGPEYAKTLERSRALLDSLTPAELKPHLVRLPNEGLVLLAGVMEAVRAKFMKEDGTGSGGGNPAGTPPDANVLKEEMHKLLTSDARKDYRHNDHAKVNARISEIAGILAKSGAKQ